MDLTENGIDKPFIDSPSMQAQRQRMMFGHVRDALIATGYSVPDNFVKSIDTLGAKEAIHRVINDVDKELEFNNNLIKNSEASFGKATSLEWWMAMAFIPENDRARTYQFFKLAAQKKIKTEPHHFRYLKDVIEDDETQIFELSEPLCEILSHTDSERTKSPYPDLFMETNFKVGRYTIRAMKYTETSIVEENTEDHSSVELKKDDPVLDVLMTWDDDGQCAVSLLQYPLNADETTSKAVWNFFHSFAHFVNEPEVSIYEIPFNPKNNERRRAAGKSTVAPMRRITLTGALEIYVKKMSATFYSSSGKSMSRHWVKGHWFTFHNKKHYKNIYKMTPMERCSAGYMTVGDEVKKWRKPFVCGKGDFSKPIYEVCLPEETQHKNKSYKLVPDKQ